MGSVAKFQESRGTRRREFADAKKNGTMAPRSNTGEKLGEKPGFQRMESKRRFEPLVEVGREDVFVACTVDVSDLEQPKYAGKFPEVEQRDQFMLLFVHAANKGHLFHIQTLPRSIMRFQYIRLLLLGEAMAASPSLQQLLKVRTPRHMDGPDLEQLVEQAVTGISSRDTGLLLALVERQICQQEDKLEKDPRNMLIRDTIGSTFNLFFNWIAFLIAAEKLARRYRMSKQAVLQELVIEYDDYVVDHILPMNVDLSFQGHGENQEVLEDTELAMMVEILKNQRLHFHKIMSDVVTRYEAELYANDGNRESKDVLHVLWYIQQKSTLDVWGQGVWVLEVEAPIATMRRKGSQVTTSREEVKKLSGIPKLLSLQRVELEGQLTASVVSNPDFVEVTINIANIGCRVANASWNQDRFGHFPSALSLLVKPLNACALLSVNKSSRNMMFKLALHEQVQVGLSIGVSSPVQGAIGAAVQAGALLATSGAPWEFEQLEEDENGGSFNWILTNLGGKPFNHLNPFVGQKKTSLFRIGRRPLANPLLGLPFGSDGSILFSDEEYAEGLRWRFPIQLEGTSVAWLIQGSVDTTILSGKGFWETRTLHFEHVLEQNLIPDPEEPEKKDKKKKKAKKAK